MWPFCLVSTHCAVLHTNNSMRNTSATTDNSRDVLKLSYINVTKNQHLHTGGERKEDKGKSMIRAL